MVLNVAAGYAARMYQLGPVRRDSRSADLHVDISNTQKGRDFDFVLKGHHLRVSPGRHRDGKGGDVDWYAVLTGQEKVALFNQILAAYRVPGVGRDNIKASALVVVENPDPEARPEQRHLIFVGINTDRIAADMYKDCAEQSAVNVANNSIAQHAYYKRGVMPEPVKILETHIMGGRSADPNNPESRPIRAICPCGKCTDMLAKEMQPGGKVFVYPQNNGNMPVRINSKATQFSQVKGMDVWETTIDHLNAQRIIELKEADASAQRSAWNSAVDYLMDPQPFPVSDAVLAQELANKKARRESVAELDIAQGDPLAIDTYLNHRLLEMLNDRAEAAQIDRSGRATVEQWLRKEINYARVVALKISDGTYRVGSDVSASMDKAYSSAAMNALGNTISVLGTRRVEQLIAREFNPGCIARGQMPTSPKEELERTVKRADPARIHQFVCSYAPFSAAAQPEAVIREWTQQFSLPLPMIYTGHFTGNPRSVTATEGKTAGRG